MKDSITVIGGSGFLGSHVADQLTKLGNHVVIFDSQESPYFTKDQKMIVGDILDQDLLQQAISGSKYVYNFAGIAEIKESNENPLESIEYNILGSANAIEQSRKEGVEKYIYASSMYVYSNKGGFYGATKQAAELIIEAYTRMYNIKHTLLRYGTLYGPRAQPWNSLNKYVYEAIQKGKIQYIGSGDEIREYIHVKDAAKLSAKVIDKKYDNRGFNITGTQVYKSSEMLNMIKEIAQNEVKIDYMTATESSDHYTITPYRHIPKKAMKLVPDEFVDLGSGILDLMESISNEEEIV